MMPVAHNAMLKLPVYSRTTPRNKVKSTLVRLAISATTPEAVAMKAGETLLPARLKTEP
ncbi:MAG: hypothetical protein GX776_05320 [Oxalobacter sp.]|nr:hypothetical protein [Oxalobacter sp.]